MRKMLVDVMLQRVSVVLALYACQVLSLGDPTEGLWVQQHVGAVKEVSIDDKSRSVLVSSESGVIASIDADTSQLKWRQLLDDSDVSSLRANLTSSSLFPPSSGSDTLRLQGRVLSTLSHTIPSVFRTWNVRDGSMLFESTPFSMTGRIRPDTPSVRGALLSVDENTHVFVDSEDVLNMHESRGASRWKNENGIDLFGELTEQSRLLYESSHSHDLCVFDSTVFVLSYFVDKVVVNTFESSSGAFKTTATLPHKCGSFPSQFTSFQSTNSGSDSGLELTLSYTCGASISSSSSSVNEGAVAVEVLSLDSLKLSVLGEQSILLNPSAVATDLSTSVQRYLADPPSGSASASKAVAFTSGVECKVVFGSSSSHQKSFLKGNLITRVVSMSLTEDGLNYHLTLGKKGDDFYKTLLTNANLLLRNDNEYLPSVKRCWIESFDLSSSQPISLLTLTDDGAFSDWKVSLKSGKLTRQWKRDESLANVLSAELFEETKEDTRCVTEHECEELYHRDFPAFLPRLMNDLTLVDDYLLALLSDLPRIFSQMSSKLLMSVLEKLPVLDNLVSRFLGVEITMFSDWVESVRLSDFIAGMNGENGNGRGSGNTIEAGSKIAVVSTEWNTVFGIHTDSGRVLWSVWLPGHLPMNDDAFDSDDYSLVSTLKIREHPQHFAAVMSSKKHPELIRVYSIVSPMHTESPNIHLHTIVNTDPDPSPVRAAFVTNLVIPASSSSNGGGQSTTTTTVNQGGSDLDTENDHIALLITEQGRVLVFPQTEQATSMVEKSFRSIFFHISDLGSASSNAQSIEGFTLRMKKKRQESNEESDSSSVVGFESELLWRRSFEGSNEEMISVSGQARGQKIVNAVYRTGFKNALYKYLNPHLIGIVTFRSRVSFNSQSGADSSNRDSDASYDSSSASELSGSSSRRRGSVYSDTEAQQCDNVLDASEQGLCGTVHFYLMDTVTGRVIFHEFHESALKKHASMVIYGNKLIYNYFNVMDGLTEVHVRDLWLNDPSTSLLSEGRFGSNQGWVVGESPLLASQNGENVFSSFTAMNGAKPFVTSQSYHSRLAISKILGPSNTRYGITKKVVFVQLVQGSVMTIHEQYLNSRRPITDEPKEEHRNEAAPPYKEFLPMSTLSIVTHGLLLKRIASMSSASAAIESTTVLFGYGLDIFHRRLTPSGAFDRIGDDFDFLILFGILFGIVFAINAAGYYGRRKKMQEQWQ